MCKNTGWEGGCGQPGLMNTGNTGPAGYLMRTGQGARCNTTGQLAPEPFWA